MKKSDLVKIINKELRNMSDSSQTERDLLFKLAGLYGIVLTKVRCTEYPSAESDN